VRETCQCALCDLRRQGVWLAQRGRSTSGRRETEEELSNSLRLAVNDQSEERALAVPIG
jgi:hypothetical protein